MLIDKIEISEKDNKLDIKITLNGKFKEHSLNYNELETLNLVSWQSKKQAVKSLLFVYPKTIKLEPNFDFLRSELVTISLVSFRLKLVGNTPLNKHLKFAMLLNLSYRVLTSFVGIERFV